RETDRAFAAFVFERFSPIEFLGNVVGNLRVEFSLCIRKSIVDGVGSTFWKQRRAVELEQLLLDEPPHHVRGIGDVTAVGELALESITVQKRHEQLEIRFLAIVWRGGQQQKMPCKAGKHLTKTISLGVFDLVPEIRGAEFVGFIAYDQIPVGLLEFDLSVLV